MERLESSLPFLEAIEHLKNLPRAGWCQRKIPNPENVANHMYQMQWFCKLHPDLSTKELERAIFMCSTHDIGEVTAGDITPADGIKPEEKHMREQLGVEYLCCLLQSSTAELASKMMDCWLEYERGTTRVARIVHQVDKLECLHQAFIYRKRYGRGYNLEDFQGLRAKIEDAWLSKEADRILADWAKLDDQQTLPIIFVIGGPGVGKGTLCTPLSNEIDYEHISVGDLLREEQKKPGSPYASFIAKSIRLSITIPPIITMRLLQNKIEAIGDKSKGILIDGFPRSIEQAVTFEEQVSSNYSTIYLRCSTDILRTRVTERAQFSDRADDDPATFQKRIDSFEATNQLIVDHLSKNRLLNVDASGKIDEVYSSVREFLKDQA